jgi:homoserine dehydrogenase
VKVALLGFGTVGRSVARLILESSAPLTLTHIFNRDVDRKRVDWVPDTVRWTDRIDDVLGSDAEILVEVVGGLDPAGSWHRAAIAAGKSIVTANKQLMAHEGGELLRLAAQRDVHLGFEAAVAGGIPVIRAIREGLAGDALVQIAGILNGTCNYMLTSMEADGLAFPNALAEAQKRGFAEADPTDDLDGYDARAKLCILARIGLHVAVRPADVPCRSIRPISDVDFTYARRLGYTIRQVARVARLDNGPEGASVEASVEPSLVPTEAVLARVRGSENLVLTTGEHGSETGFFGRGAGGGPTAVAILSDVLSIVRHTSPPGWFGDAAADRPATVTERRTVPHYLRFIVQDRPGIIAALASRLAAHELNIDAVLQEPGWPKDALPFVITLEPSRRARVLQALDEIGPLDFNVEPPLSLPILD